MSTNCKNLVRSVRYVLRLLVSEGTVKRREKTSSLYVALLANRPGRLHSRLFHTFPSLVKRCCLNGWQVFLWTFLCLLLNLWVKSYSVHFVSLTQESFLGGSPSKGGSINTQLYFSPENGRQIRPNTWRSSSFSCCWVCAKVY